MLYVGIDWSDQALDFQMRDDQDQVLADGQVTATLEGLSELYEKLETHGPPKEIGVVLETCHGAWVQPLLDRGYRVYAVNPKAVERFRQALLLQGDKSDRIDRRVLSIFLKCLHAELRVLRPDAPEIVALRIACQNRLRLVEEHTAKVNELWAVLKGYYPAFLELFGQIDSDIALAFLEAFSTQDQGRSLTEAKFRSWLADHHYTQPHRVDAMVQHLKRPVIEVPEHLQKAEAPLIRYLAGSLRRLGTEIDRRDQDIRDRFEQCPESDWAGSLPGAGPVLGPALLACVGRDKKRFTDATQAQALFGTAPVTVQSGRSRMVHFRWGCWKFARRTLQLLAEQSIRFCGWAEAFYRRQRARGHKHHHALRELAHKWLKIILALQRTGQRYNEQRYVKSLHKHRLKSASPVLVS